MGYQQPSHIKHSHSSPPPLHPPHTHPHKAQEEARFLEETTKLNIFLNGKRDELETWKRGEWQRKQVRPQYTSCISLHTTHALLTYFNQPTWCTHTHMHTSLHTHTRTHAHTHTHTHTHPISSQWEHYLSCDDLPDPSDKKALSTYLSLYEEDTRDPSIEGTLQGIQQCLTVSSTEFLTAKLNIPNTCSSVGESHVRFWCAGQRLGSA